MFVCIAVGASARMVSQSNFNSFCFVNMRDFIFAFLTESIFRILCYVKILCTLSLSMLEYRWPIGGGYHWLVR